MKPSCKADKATAIKEDAEKDLNEALSGADSPLLNPIYKKVCE